MTKAVHLLFDLQSDGQRARSFLGELSQSGLDIQVTGASRKESIADTQRPALLTERMRAADLVVVLISPSAASSRQLSEELAYARAAAKPILGVLVGGATTQSNLPRGIERTKVYGWDWGTLKRAFGV